jgi:hypothetical protein
MFSLPVAGCIGDVLSDGDAYICMPSRMHEKKKLLHAYIVAASTHKQKAKLLSVDRDVCVTCEPCKLLT